MPNPFDFMQGQKKPKEIQERINKANEDVNDLIENAKLCLSDPKFSQFKEKYQEVFAQLIQVLLEIPRNDDRIFSAQIDSIRIKIQVLQGFGLVIKDAASLQKRPIVPTTTEGADNAKKTA